MRHLIEITFINGNVATYDCHTLKEQEEVYEEFASSLWTNKTIRLGNTIINLNNVCMVKKV